MLTNCLPHEFLICDKIHSASEEKKNKKKKKERKQKKSYKEKKKKKRKRKRKKEKNVGAIPGMEPGTFGQRDTNALGYYYIR